MPLLSGTIDGNQLYASRLSVFLGKQESAGTAKLADFIGPETTTSEYARILLSSSGDRATDQFVEVHIYGGFNLSAVSTVCGT